MRGGRWVWIVVFALAFAIVAVIGGFVGVQLSTTSTPSLDQEVTTSIPDITGNYTPGKDNSTFTVKVDPHQTPHSRGHSLEVDIPGALINKFAPGQSWLQTWLPPTATVVAAMIAIGAALLALRGVRMQVRQDKDSDHLADLWERFEWVLTMVKKKELTLPQATRFLTSISSVAGTLDMSLTALIRDYVDLVLVEYKRRQDAEAALRAAPGSGQA